MAAAQAPIPAAGFARLLDALGNEQDSADARYATLRRKLVWFFDTRGVPPDDAADETLTRIARKLEAGESIREVETYALGVARFVLRESFRPRIETPLLPDAPEPVATRPDDESAAEVRTECMDGCLGRFANEERELILAYYLGERRGRIDARRDLANTLGIPLPALRIRAFRIRQRLHRCVVDCVDQRGNAMKGSIGAVRKSGGFSPRAPGARE